ncbi:MAG: ABC transporter ATP-binding protein [Proteobacteria bacterium]|nr:ABC transporter ATP-binding protein [Pseudomonadota bacterium]
MAAPGTNAFEGAHLALAGLSKRYGAGPPVVDDLNLEIARGELVALLGPSGCGKTTTLRMIAGLVPPTGGRVAVSGEDITRIPPYRRNMGLVFQSYALFPHLSVAANVAFGLEMRGIEKGETARRVEEALALVRLSGLGGRRIRELSGGQQQRVALARALVIRPEILLLDEPLSNLDAKLREDMRGEIRDIQQQLGITAIFVTHDQVEALTMCDRIVVMERGRAAQVDHPHAIYERPVNPFVAAFVGRINAFSGRVRAAGGGIAEIEVAGGIIRAPSQLAPGDAALVMVRPHRISLEAPGAGGGGSSNRLRARILKTIYVGDIVQFQAEIGETLVQAERGTAGAEWSGWQPGQEVTLAWEVADTLVFQPGATA